MSILIGLLICSCATPIAPTGGETDRSGPKLISTTPSSGTTNFSDDEIRFEFQDWVDRASFQRALSIEPGLDLDFEIKWKRKTAIIRLNSPLPDSTTVIFSLDKELRDTRSNRIAEPIKIAVSTGDEIDQEAVIFKVISAYPSANKTEPVVLLYREPFDINEASFYASSADTSGIIRFSYLAQGQYKAILVHDINRNRTWDRNREFAQPMNTEFFNISEVDTSEFLPFYYAKRDTISPTVQNIGLFSENRIRVQFSKPIPYKVENELILNDSLGNQINAYHLYNDRREQSIAFFQTLSSLVDRQFYTFSRGNLTDANGNSLRFSYTQFEGSSEPDTTLLRYIAPFGGESLSGVDNLHIRYSTQITDSSVLDSLKIFVNREDARSDFSITLDKNRLILTPNNRWNSSNSYQIKTWDPSLATFKDVRIQVVDDADAGDLSVIVSDSLSQGNDIQITLFNAAGTVYLQEVFSDSLTLSGLRPGSYHLLLHEVVTESNLINIGSIDPFISPRFIYADPRFPIRARMSSELILD